MSIDQLERLEGLIDNLVYAVVDPDFSHEERTERREKLSEAIRAALHSISAQVSEEMIEAALNARVPGGAQVWHWLPTVNREAPHPTACSVMQCALEAALAMLAKGDGR